MGAIRDACPKKGACEKECEDDQEYQRLIDLLSEMHKNNETRVAALYHAEKKDFNEDHPKFEEVFAMKGKLFGLASKCKLSWVSPL